MDNTTTRSSLATKTIKRSTACAGAIAAVLVSFSLFGRATAPQVPSNTWAPASDMSVARAGASAVLLYDGRMLITGGKTDAGMSASAERFSPNSGAFLSTPSMLNARANHTSTLLDDGRVLVAGGVGADGQALNAAEIYDPETNAWMAAAPMYRARAGHTATSLYDGRVVMAGGDDAGAPIDSLELFDPYEGVFTLANGLLNHPRTGHAAALSYDGLVVIGGGFDGAHALASVDVYDPYEDVVTSGASLVRARAGHTATTLLDGKMLFVGGASDASDLASAEIYDPAGNTMTLIGGSLADGRQRHQAILLPHNNAVLIVGGTSNGNAVTTAELYKSWLGDGGAFEAAGAPNVPRAWATGGSLSLPAGLTIRTGPNDGLVLLAGGSPSADASSPGATAELYGFATVRTDKADYTPGQTVTITGSGWVPGETVTLTLAQVPFHDVHTLEPVTADASGTISSTEFVPEPDDVGTRFYLTASGSQSQAQTSFTDALSILTANLNGSSQVTVAPGASITALVQVAVGSPSVWKGTGWRIATTPPGTTTCANTADSSASTAYDTFTITAPATQGTYNAYFIAYDSGSCTSGASAAYTMDNAVIVDAAPVITSVTGPANGTYRTGQNLDFTVNFNEPVTVTGTPIISLTIGSTTRFASYVSGSGTSALVFRYTIQAGDTDTNGIAVDIADRLEWWDNQRLLEQKRRADLHPTDHNGSAGRWDCTDGDDRRAVGDIHHRGPGHLHGDVCGHAFSSSTLSSADITLNATGNANAASITVSGTGTTRTVTLSTITGDGTLGISIAAGTATDTAGNTAPAAGPSATFSVDNTPPELNSVTGPADGSYRAAQNLDFTVNYSKNVTVVTTGGTPAIRLDDWLDLAQCQLCLRHRNERSGVPIYGPGRRHRH